MKECPECGSQLVLNGQKKKFNNSGVHTRTYQQYLCRTCGKHLASLTWSAEKTPVAGVGSAVKMEGNHETLSVCGDYSTNETNHKLVLESFLLFCKVDVERWEVDRYLVNGWDTTINNKDEGVLTKTNYQIKVWLKRKEPNHLEIGFEKFLEKIPLYSPAVCHKKIEKTGIALEMAPFDVHFGKLACAAETGRRNYDLDIACEDFTTATDQLLTSGVKFGPEKIFYIIGQDLFHIDNIQGKTTSGTHDMDVDGRMPKIFEKAFETVLKSIYKCRNVAPVRIIWIPGNHDYIASMFLVYTLREHFRKDPMVTIDISDEGGKTSRKCELWGNLLVGWCHKITGRAHSWVNELAHAFPNEWGKSKFREWHYGHLHKKSETMTYPIMTQGGVLLRQLTALSPIDKWHYEENFTDALPGGEMLIWSKDSGVIGNHTAWTETGV